VTVGTNAGSSEDAAVKEAFSIAKTERGELAGLAKLIAVPIGGWPSADQLLLHG